VCACACLQQICDNRISRQASGKVHSGRLCTHTTYTYTPYACIIHIHTYGPYVHTHIAYAHPRIHTSSLCTHITYTPYACITHTYTYAHIHTDSLCTYTYGQSVHTHTHTTHTPYACITQTYTYAHTRAFIRAVCAHTHYIHKYIALTHTINEPSINTHQYRTHAFVWTIYTDSQCTYKYAQVTHITQM